MDNSESRDNNNHKNKNSQKRKLRLQFFLIIVLLIFIIFLAISSFIGTWNGEVEETKIISSSSSESSSFVVQSSKYEDRYLKIVEEYDDVVIPENDIEDEYYIGQTLFVGDSNTAGLSGYGYLSLQNVLGLIGMPIQEVNIKQCMWFVGYENPVTMPTAVGMLKPRRVILNFGTNNVGGIEPDEFIEYYESVIDRIEKNYPYADIIVESILPVAKKRSYPKITRDGIDDLNIALLEMCRERDLAFLNTAEAFKDEDTGYAIPEYFGKDGLHLTSDGYRALLDYVDTHKRIIKDNRPARGAIPTRMNAPVVESSSEEQPV